MNYDPISYLGLSCPSGGDFYICQDSKGRFLGCCDIDPCGRDGGECPSSALHPASFDTDRYNEIPAQTCASSTEHSSLWYTCINGPTFLGCCAANPCNNEGVCPKDSLTGATLNDDPRKASVFSTTAATATSTSSSTSTSTLTSASTSSTDTSTSAPTSTTIPATPMPSPTSNNQRSSGASIGGIVGGIIGGIVVLALVVFIYFLYRRRRRRALATGQPNEDAMATPPPPWSPYHDSFGHRSTVPATLVTPSAVSTFPKSLSASLGSIIGLKGPSARKRWSFRASFGRETNDAAWARVTHNNGQASQGFLNPVVELESPPLGGILVRGRLHDSVYYEVEGSLPNISAREMES